MKLIYGGLLALAFSSSLTGCAEKPRMTQGPETNSAGSNAGDTAAKTACEPSAMVSLTYDDALPSQLANAAPALQAHHLPATFFLTNVTGAGLTSWGTLKSQGHELAAHTLNHPCPKVNTWVTAGNANEDYDAQRMATELDSNIAQLLAMGQQAPYTFAYPCGLDWIGEAKQSYVELVQQRFVAARGVTGGLITSLADSFHVPAYFLTDSAASLISVVDSAIKHQARVVFGFHGVGGDHSAVSTEAHEALLAYLEQQSSAVRVLPFGAAAECMKQR